MAEVLPWTVGQVVKVKPRTWAGINRPGGHGKITKVEGQGDDIRLTVKYVLGGSDKDLDPCLLEVPQELGTRDRTKRRSALTVAPAEEHKAKKQRSKKLSLPPTALGKGSARTHTTCKENTRNLKSTAAGPIAATTATTYGKATAAVVSVAKKTAEDSNGNTRSVQPRRRRRRADSTKKAPPHHNRPADLPTEIVIRRYHTRVVDFASPITERGAEDGRKYMLSNFAKPAVASSPSTLFGHSNEDEAGLAVCCGGSADGEGKSHAGRYAEGDPFSESEKSEPSMPSPEDMDLAENNTPKVPMKKRVTVKSVVDQEMKQAADFVNDMLQSQPGKPQSPKEKPSSNVPKTSPRQDELMAVFLSLIDHNEGTVEEDCLVQQINRHSSGARDFRDDEVKELLENLATSNKIMCCDDHIYWL